MTASTVTVKLPKELYSKLNAMAKQERIDVVELLNRLAASSLEESMAVPPTTAAFQRILERATDLGVTDLSEQHDHYLYGTEKR